MATSAQHLSVGPKFYDKRLQNSFCFPSTSFPRCRGNESTPIRRQEISQLRSALHLAKGAIEHVHLSEREAGLYSQYFIVPIKDGGLCSILDLRGLNCTLWTYRFKMLTLKLIVSEIQSKPIFTSRLCQKTGSLPMSSASFQPSLVPMHIHQVHESCSGSSATSGHPCTELHRQLAHSISV